MWRKILCALNMHSWHEVRKSTYVNNKQYPVAPVTACKYCGKLYASYITWYLRNRKIDLKNDDNFR